MLGRTLFHASTALNLILLFAMCRQQFWRYKPVLCFLQLLLFLETPLFLFASPKVYAWIWPTFDQYNILVVLAYIVSCGMDCKRFRIAAFLLTFCPMIKLALWCNFIGDSEYRTSSLHYARILIDLAATIVLIWAVNSYAGKEKMHARHSNEADRSSRAQPAASTA